MKIQDFVKLQNSLFVHDYLNNALPFRFDNHFQTLDVIHGKSTKASELGCLYVPHSRTTKFGFKSFSHWCIDTRNFLTLRLGTKLKDLSRLKLKKPRLFDFFSTHTSSTFTSVCFLLSLISHSRWVKPYLPLPIFPLHSFITFFHFDY